MLNPQEIEELNNRLHQAVCNICTDHKPDGSCCYPDRSKSPLFAHVERLVDLAREVHSDRMKPYVERLRSDVCTVCNAPRWRGNCQVTSEGLCAVDAYLPVIIEEIEAFLAEKGKKESQGSSG
ncbi:MAG TPA: hypothetical protein VGK99_09380 [Acidobacteriota bacterium]|jgi:hypothetical protein